MQKKNKIVKNEYKCDGIVQLKTRTKLMTSMSTGRRKIFKSFNKPNIVIMDKNLAATKGTYHTHKNGSDIPLRGTNAVTQHMENTNELTGKTQHQGKSKSQDHSFMDRLKVDNERYNSTKGYIERKSIGKPTKIAKYTQTIKLGPIPDEEGWVYKRDDDGDIIRWHSWRYDSMIVVNIDGCEKVVPNQSVLGKEVLAGKLITWEQKAMLEKSKFPKDKYQLHKYIAEGYPFVNNDCTIRDFGRHYTVTEVNDKIKYYDAREKHDDWYYRVPTSGGETRHWLPSESDEKYKSTKIKVHWLILWAMATIIFIVVATMLFALITSRKTGIMLTDGGIVKQLRNIR